MVNSREQAGLTARARETSQPTRRNAIVPKIECTAQYGYRPLATRSKTLRIHATVPSGEASRLPEIRKIVIKL
jgi:hypothetical protein